MIPDIITSAITSCFDSMSDNEFVAARGRQTAKLWLPIARRQVHESRALKYGLDPYRPKFHGINPLTGLPITIVFNEPAPGRERLMNWNTLTKCWFYSEDAGLTWQRVEDDRWGEYAVKCDALINEPKPNEH